MILKLNYYCDESKNIIYGRNLYPNVYPGGIFTKEQASANSTGMGRAFIQVYNWYNRK